MHSNSIRVVTIRGSVRPGNYTGMALNLVVDELRRDSGISVDTIDPAGLELALPGAAGGADAAAKLQDAVSAATGVVFATPEYHGSFSSVTKLLIDNLGFPSVLAKKPIALLGVAAGQIGAIKALEHLRSVCSHVGAIVLPGPVSVAGVQSKFDDDGNCLDARIEKRIRRLATTLTDYIRSSLCPKIALEEMVRENVSASTQGSSSE